MRPQSILNSYCYWACFNKNDWYLLEGKFGCHSKSKELVALSKDIQGHWQGRIIPLCHKLPPQKSLQEMMKQSEDFLRRWGEV